MLLLIAMKRGFVLLVAVGVALFAFQLGNSNQVAFAASNAAQGLQISPTIINLNADPGKSYILKLSILNVTTGDLIFKSAVNDFQAKDESGTPNVLLNNPLPPTASVVKWVEPIGSIPLKSKQSKDILVKVDVPASAEAGGHYGVIRFSGAAPAEQQNGVALSASAGVLLLVRISGTITEQISFKQFFTQQNGTQKNRFDHSPITFVERLQNSGNVHVAPTGVISVKNMFGKDVADIKVNTTNGNVLPGSIRRFEQEFSKKNLFGKYSATANLNYGTSGKTASASLSFWVIPYKLVALILVAFIIAVFLLRLMIKRYNRWVVKKSRRR